MAHNASVNPTQPQPNPSTFILTLKEKSLTANQLISQNFTDVQLPNGQLVELAAQPIFFNSTGVVHLGAIQRLYPFKIGTTSGLFIWVIVQGQRTTFYQSGILRRVGFDKSPHLGYEVSPLYRVRGEQTCSRLPPRTASVEISILHYFRKLKDPRREGELFTSTSRTSSSLPSVPPLPVHKIGKK